MFTICHYLNENFICLLTSFLLNKLLHVIDLREGTEGWTKEGGTEGGVRKEAGAREGGKEEGGRGDEKGWTRIGNGRMGKRRESGIQLYSISLQDFKGTPSYIFSPDFAYAYSYRRQHTCFSTSASESAILWFDLTPKTEDQKLAQSDYD